MEHKNLSGYKNATDSLLIVKVTKQSTCSQSNQESMCDQSYRESTYSIVKDNLSIPNYINQCVVKITVNQCVVKITVNQYVVKITVNLCLVKVTAIYV